MKLRRALVSVAAAAALMVSGLGVLPVSADDRDFIIVNESSSAVTGLWVARSDSDSWGSQVLSSDIAAGGGSRQIVFTYPAPGVCLYWVHAEHQDRDTSELQNVNLCEIFIITITDTDISAT
jgi:hypothetical protein